MLKIGGRLAINRNALTRTRMDKLKTRGMERNPRNQRLRRFRPVVFSIADNRMAQRQKLRSDLILQSCHQLDPDERSIRKKAFDGVSKFGSRRLGVSRRAQLLKHSFPSKIVHERPCLHVETAPHYREIPPYRSLVEKLSHQRISIGIGLRKQQSPGRKTIDAMHDQSSLSLQLEFCGQQRQSGRSIGALNRHREKSGRFVENDHGIVLVKYGKLMRETRPAPVFLCRHRVGRNPIRLCRTAATLSRRFLHWPKCPTIRPLSSHSADHRKRESRFRLPGWPETELPPLIRLVVGLVTSDDGVQAQGTGGGVVGGGR